MATRWFHQQNKTILDFITWNTEAAAWQTCHHCIAMKQLMQQGEVSALTYNIAQSTVLGIKRYCYSCCRPTANLTSKLRGATSQWIHQKQTKLHSRSYLPDVLEFLRAVMHLCKSGICDLMALRKAFTVLLGQVLAFGVQSSCWIWTLHPTVSPSTSRQPRRCWYHILSCKIPLFYLGWSLTLPIENCLHLRGCWIPLKCWVKVTGERLHEHVKIFIQWMILNDCHFKANTELGLRPI